MTNVEYEAGERLSLTLRRPESDIPWGFRLQGGVDFSIPLSVQVVQPNSLAERFGLQKGDGIERINNQSADVLSHEDAKKEIIRSGNDIALIILRGAVRIWKPQVTPMSELKPTQLNLVHTATGDQIIPVQKTSLARPQPDQESAHIGSSHNRAARPFGGDTGATPDKQATASVVHSQFNSPIGLYSADNIADTYSSQTRGITDQVQGLDLSDRGVGTRMSGGTYQAMPGSPSGDSPTSDDPLPTNISHDLPIPASPTPCTDDALLQDRGSECPDTLPPPPAPLTHQETNGPSPKVSESMNDSVNMNQSRSFYQVESELSQLDSADASSGGGPSGFRSVRAPEPMPPGQQPSRPPMSRCHACDMLITGVFVKASGQPYHVQCFKCTSCSMNLKQKGVIVVEGKLYCDVHAKRAAQPPGAGMVAVPTFQ